MNKSQDTPDLVSVGLAMLQGQSMASMSILIAMVNASKDVKSLLEIKRFVTVVAPHAIPDAAKVLPFPKGLERLVKQGFDTYCRQVTRAIDIRIGVLSRSAPKSPPQS